jgi:serine/threonine protein kinase
MNDGHVPTFPWDPDRWDPGKLSESVKQFPRSGQRLVDRYEIFGVIEGGLGIVLFATDLETGQNYAIKTYKQDFADSPSDLERFKEEIDIWISLEPHPHIAKAYFVEVIDGRPFLFMEYVSDGFHGSLRDLIGKLGPNQAANLGYQICLALEFVNQRQSKIVHADLKPENVLITPEGKAKVTDFGLAGLFNFTDERFPRQRYGSPPYMPPEQLNGKIVDQQSDIFAYGMMFYEMLDGKLPYPFKLKGDQSGQRNELKKFYASMGQAFFIDDYGHSPWTAIIENKTIDLGLKRIIMGCVFPNRSNRWRSFHELRQYLDAELQDVIDTPESAGEMVDLHHKALSLYRIGHLSKALSTFNLALQRDPTNAQLWLDAALALVDNNRYSDAYRFVLQARTLKPDIEIGEPRLSHLLDESADLIEKG